MKPVLISPPSAPPVTLEEVKRQVRVDHADDDALLGGYIEAAVAHLDGLHGVLRRCIVKQTWRLSMPDGFGRMLALPFPDVSSVTITFTDPEGGALTEFQLREGVVHSDVAVSRPVNVDFAAGFGGAADAPAPIKVAIMMLVAHWYENREAAGAPAAALPMAVDMLLAPYRWLSV